MTSLFRFSATSMFIAFIHFNFSSCVDKYCPDKEKFLLSYSDFTNDVSDHYNAFETEDWTKLDKEYKHYVDTCYPKFKSGMDIKDKVDFLKLTFMYNVYREESQSAPDVDKLQTTNLKEEIQELGDDAQHELEKYIKDTLGRELENAVDDILDGLNEIGDQIKDWLNTENEN